MEDILQLVTRGASATSMVLWYYTCSALISVGLEGASAFARLNLLVCFTLVAFFAGAYLSTKLEQMEIALRSRQDSHWQPWRAAVIHSSDIVQDLVGYVRRHTVRSCNSDAQLVSCCDPPLPLCPSSLVLPPPLATPWPATTSPSIEGTYRRVQSGHVVSPQVAGCLSVDVVTTTFATLGLGPTLPVLSANAALTALATGLASLHLSRAGNQRIAADREVRWRWPIGSPLDP